MPIELRIQSGARTGVSQSFDKSVIALGRHPMCDLRFDANQDLDVSTRHGEIRALDGRYSIHDAQSTNGTFVNGLRVPSGGSLPLRDKDVIAFGLEGPQVSVRIGETLADPTPPKTVPQLDVLPSTNDDASGFAAPAPKRGRTSERVAFAVQEQTRRLRIAVLLAVVLLGGATGALFYKSSRDAEKNARDAAERDARIKQLMAANEEVNRELKTRLQGDTVLTNTLQRHNDSLTRAVREARNAAQAAAASSALIRSHDLQRKFVEMGLPAVREANDPAVALLSTEIGGQPFEASGFSATSSGVIVTNRHVVMDSTGQRASRISVKFANSRIWRHAHILKLPDDPNIDLALVQVEDGGPKFPTVHEIAPSVDSPVGSSIATIGFPLGTELPMGGAGLENIARTSLTVGTISKSVSGLLQIDAFASHGSSGSPVFDAHGHVIGVVWGGAKDAPGRIVFAVPADQIRELLTGVK
jgi:S1-C subfamily serine protease